MLKANENYTEKFGLDLTEEQFNNMKEAVTHHIHMAMLAMRIEFDENTKDTPARIAKMWLGGFVGDDRELGSGRFAPPVRIPTFPNEHKTKTPITKEVRIVSNCSHHFVPFWGKAKISYVPGEYVLGLSKLQRLVDWVCQRFWLQEDLTWEIHRIIQEAAGTEHVSVELLDIEHGCAVFRGVKTEGGFTTEAKTGMFANN